MEVTLKLSRPIEAHGEQYAELVICKPNGHDLFQAGYPFKIETSPGGATVQVIDPGAVRKMISRLAKIPVSSVDQLDIGDWTAAMGTVMSFFGTAPAASSKPISTPGDGGATSNSSSA